MRVIPIKGSRNVYTCQVYLLLGDWKKVGDPNTLIDLGADPTIIEVLEETDTGVGKKKVEQVILTHSHSDHCAILPQIRKRFDPVVYAFSPYLEGVDRVLEGGEVLHVGDRWAEVIHTPGHSEDSVCICFPEDRMIFSGDLPLRGCFRGGAGARAAKSCPRESEQVRIYSGHDDLWTSVMDVAGGLKLQNHSCGR